MEHQLSKQSVELDAAGIVLIRPFRDVEITIDDAREVIGHMTSAYGTVRRPTLVDISQLRGVSREARAFFGGRETMAVESAIAFIVKSPLSRILGNVYLGINRKNIPTRLFTTEPEAVEWLQGFLAKD
jgi:hypothetical protein